MATAQQTEMHGTMAEFETPVELMSAIKSARGAGYERMDAYAPHEIHGLDKALGLPPSRLPLYILLGGIAGALLGYGLQYYASVQSYPLNIGGRPNHSWPAFIVVTFEMTILCAGLTAVVGLILLCKLPRPYHPVFNAPQFLRASQDRFFLCIEAADPLYDASAIRRFFEGMQPLSIAEVPK
jgi:hypothetical protein